MTIHKLGSFSIGDNWFGACGWVRSWCTFNYNQEVVFKKKKTRLVQLVAGPKL